MREAKCGPSHIGIVQVVINYPSFNCNIQCFTMTMPFNKILILYVIPCKLSCDFCILTILYIHVIFMTNKSVMTFLYVNKYLRIRESTRPSRSIKASFYIPVNRLNFPTTEGFVIKMSLKLIYQYMVIFFNFRPTSNHLHPLQVENCDSNSRLVVDKMIERTKCRSR